MIMHPDEKEIAAYMLDGLSEENDINVGNHIIQCDECFNKARKYLKIEILWENWDHESHLKAYLEAKLSRQKSLKEKDVEKKKELEDPEI